MVSNLDKYEIKKTFLKILVVRNKYQDKEKGFFLSKIREKNQKKLECKTG